MRNWLFVHTCIALEFLAWGMEEVGRKGGFDIEKRFLFHIFCFDNK